MRKKLIVTGLSVLIGAATGLCSDKEIEDKVEALLSRMTLEEKVGQMRQITGYGRLPEVLKAIRAGQLGSLLNAGWPKDLVTIQRVALNESPNGIPLIIGRDVIHGFRTIFPIPLGQASSWNRDLIKRGAEVAAREASEVGINWTFAPMIDVSRDPRWGRIAESLGEDPYLTSELGVAMVKGFQGEKLTGQNGSIAACAKHFVGYGATESGKDYSPTFIPHQRLRNVYLPPFRAVADAGCATFMTAFNDVNGIPITGSPFLLKDILRDEWKFDGLVVSDWDSLGQMMRQGFCEDMRDVARKSANAGCDMEMVSEAYFHNLVSLVKEREVPIENVNSSVRNILRTKFRLQLFAKPYQGRPSQSTILSDKHLQAAKDAAIQSAVLLKNDKNSLPLSNSMKIAVIGPLADAPAEQVGCWSMDAVASDSVTPLTALKQEFGSNLTYVKGLKNSRDKDQGEFGKCVDAAKNADVAVLVVGEEAILSGEGHSLAFISLPGAQEELIKKVAATGTPVVLVVMAGRPLVMENIKDSVAAILYAWHPGTMGGPAISDILVGKSVPSAKLPVSFPRTVGQIPIYYAQLRSGRPANHKMIGIPTGTPLNPVGLTCNYMDVSVAPAYPFGFGMSYTTFSYSRPKLSKRDIKKGETVTVEVDVTNTGKYKADEIVQVYITDRFASIMRPEMELKEFGRVTLAPGETKTVRFDLPSTSFEFLNPQGDRIFESGQIIIRVGGSSNDLKSVHLQVVAE